jgi:hypothetical protein
MIPAAPSLRPGLSPVASAAPSGGQPEVLHIGLNARVQRVRPADALQPRRDLRVIQIRMIAAVTADDLELAGTAAFYPALPHADRLAPQARGQAVAGLARRRYYPGFPALSPARIAGAGRRADGT